MTKHGRRTGGRWMAVPALEGGVPRRGFSLLEALVAILLTAMVIQGGWTVMATLRKAGGRTADRAEGLETVRTTAWLLGEEFQGTLPLRDWWAGEGDSVTVRAYRGLALVTGIGADGVEVCFRGVRSPNPEKDSVLFLGEGGEWTAHALEGRTRGESGCSGDGKGWAESWRVDPEPGTARLGRIYERGSYHLTLGALRYRRGGGGRQPLTPIRISDGTLEVADGGLRWSLLLSDPWGRADTLSWCGWVR
jgi:type II secretory pathway component PulJ